MSIGANKLAQVGFPAPDAMAKGSLLFSALLVCWGGLLLASMIVVGMGAFRLRQRRGKVMVGIGGMLFAALIYAAYIAVVPPHHSVVLDLSAAGIPPNGHQIANGNAVSLQGRVDARVKLPNGNAFNDRATLLMFDQAEGKIQRLFIQKSGMSQDDAFRFTAKYLHAWGLDPRNFDQWCADRRQGVHSLDDTLFCSAKNSCYPWLRLELRGDMPDSWAVNLTVEWPTEELHQTATP